MAKTQISYALGFVIVLIGMAVVAFFPEPIKQWGAGIVAFGALIMSLPFVVKK